MSGCVSTGLLWVLVPQAALKCTDLTASCEVAVTVLSRRLPAKFSADDPSLPLQSNLLASEAPHPWPSLLSGALRVCAARWSLPPAGVFCSGRNPLFFSATVFPGQPPAASWVLHDP